MRWHLYYVVAPGSGDRRPRRRVWLPGVDAATTMADLRLFAEYARRVRRAACADMKCEVRGSQIDGPYRLADTE